MQRSLVGSEMCIRDSYYYYSPFPNCCSNHRCCSPRRPPQKYAKAREHTSPSRVSLSARRKTNTNSSTRVLRLVRSPLSGVSRSTSPSTLVFVSTDRVASSSSSSSSSSLSSVDFSARRPNSTVVFRRRPSLRYPISRAQHQQRPLPTSSRARFDGLSSSSPSSTTSSPLGWRPSRIERRPTRSPVGRLGLSTSCSRYSPARFSRSGKEGNHRHIFFRL